MGAGKGKNRRARSRMLPAPTLANDPAVLVAASLATIKELHPDVEIEASERPEGIVLSVLRVLPQERGTGKASAALKSLLEYADQERKPVALTPEPLISSAEQAGRQERSAKKGLSKTALVAWYASHGFVPNKGRYKDFAFRESYIRPVEK